MLIYRELPIAVLVALPVLASILTFWGDTVFQGVFTYTLYIQCIIESLVCASLFICFIALLIIDVDNKGVVYIITGVLSILYLYLFNRNNKAMNRRQTDVLVVFDSNQSKVYINR